MASTNFTDKVTVINTDWLNDVNALTYALSGKGQLIGTTGTVIQALAAGTNGQALIADSAQSLGIKWGSEWSGWADYSPTTTVNSGSIGSIVVNSARYNYNSATKMLVVNVYISFSVTSGTPVTVFVTPPAPVTINSTMPSLPTVSVNNGSLDAGSVAISNAGSFAFSRLPIAAFSGACYVNGNFVLETA